MKNRRPAFAVAALLVSGGALWLTQSFATQREKSAASEATESSTVAPAGSAAASPDAPAVELDTRTQGWELGKRYGYRMKLATVVAFDEAGNGFDFDVIGNLELEPVVVTAESATLHASLPDARIVSRNPGAQAELDKLAAELRGAGAFFVQSGGRTGDLRVPASMSQMAASTYRQAAVALQFARAKDGAKRYTAEEFDTTGQYIAEYALGADGTWQKKKLR